MLQQTINNLARQSYMSSSKSFFQRCAELSVFVWVICVSLTLICSLEGCLWMFLVVYQRIALFPCVLPFLGIFGKHKKKGRALLSLIILGAYPLYMFIYAGPEVFTIWF